MDDGGWTANNQKDAFFGFIRSRIILLMSRRQRLLSLARVVSTLTGYWVALDSIALQ